MYDEGENNYSALRMANARVSLSQEEGSTTEHITNKKSYIR